MLHHRFTVILDKFLGSMKWNDWYYAGAWGCLTTPHRELENLSVYTTPSSYTYPKHYLGALLVRDGFSVVLLICNEQLSSKSCLLVYHQFYTPLCSCKHPAWKYYHVGDSQVLLLVFPSCYLLCSTIRCCIQLPTELNRILASSW